MALRLGQMTVLERRRVVTAGGVTEDAAAAAADAAAPLALLDPIPTGHPELDAALAVVGAGSVTSAGAGARLTPGLRDRLLQGLADRGVLHPGDRRLLGAPRRRTADPAPEAALRERLRTVLLDGADPDPRDVALLAMAGPWLASRLVPDDRLREAEGRVEEIAATFRSAPDAAAGGSAALVSAILLTTILNPLI